MTQAYTSDTEKQRHRNSRITLAIWSTHFLTLDSFKGITQKMETAVTGKDIGQQPMSFYSKQVCELSHTVHKHTLCMVYLEYDFFYKFFNAC